MKHMQVLVDGLMTTYEKTGKGKVVLLLHGWADRASGLKNLTSELARHFTVIAPDLPGFGGTQAPPTAWSLNDYAAFLKNFLEKIDASSIYAIVGHSNGGAVALRALGTNVLNVDKLVLLATAGIRDSGSGRRRALQLATKAGKILSMPLPKPMKTQLRRKLYATVGSDMLVAEHMQETFKRVVRDDVQADAAKITAPTLLLYGENDPDTPVWYGQKLHELIEVSTLEILPGAGHFAFLDRPKEVTKTILEFLK